MASKFGAVWALDVGNNSVKALHMSTDETGRAEVIGFDDIEHSKILTGVGVTQAEREELVAVSLRQFVEQNYLDKDEIVVSVPSQNSFARFVNLPPVEPKRIPEVVKFEATQQIPFDINDVQWDWQLMTDTNSSETKVGIFAIKNEVVDSVLEHFNSENLTVSCVQMAPMALYNYALHDRPEWGESASQAVIVIDIGAENTDLVVCTKTTVWQRCIAMGGNAFTKAIADAFRLNFQKAEKLKRTAPMSKYARQIFQAMRPVFTDLASEIQRSLNFYTSSNPDVKLAKVIAFGGGTKMRGLLKYLKQTLQLPVERPDSFKKLNVAAGVSTTKFHENVPDFGAVYGLALQGLGLATIESNLLPRGVARSITWRAKAKYFSLAFLLFLLVSVASLGRTAWDRVNYERKAKDRKEIRSVIAEVEQAGRNLEKQKKRAVTAEAKTKKAFQLFEYRNVVPLLHQIMLSVLPDEKNNPDQAELYRAFAEGDVKTILKVPRKQRKQIFVTGISARFVNDVETAALGEVDFVSPAFEDDSGGFDARALEEMRHFAKAAKYGRRKYVQPDQEAEQGKAGFVVTIEGYSPYENVRDLLDPYGVENDPGRWGVVTRLLHLADANSPFEMYDRTNHKHFKLETDPVAVGASMPEGVGLGKVKSVQTNPTSSAVPTAGEKVIIDPMTKEIISTVEKPDGTVTKNDHWFVLQLKIIWKDAPKKPSTGTMAR
jgi:type IV pilus assembly protein PilM